MSSKKPKLDRKYFKVETRTQGSCEEDYRQKMSATARGVKVIFIKTDESHGEKESDHLFLMKNILS